MLHKIKKFVQDFRQGYEEHVKMMHEEYLASLEPTQAPAPEPQPAPSKKVKTLYWLTIEADAYDMDMREKTEIRELEELKAYKNEHAISRRNLIYGSNRVQVYAKNGIVYIIQTIVDY